MTDEDVRRLGATFLEHRMELPHLLRIEPVAPVPSLGDLPPALTDDEAMRAVYCYPTVWMEWVPATYEDETCMFRHQRGAFDELIARGARMAHGIDAELYVVYVDSASDADPDNRRTLQENIQFAENLGARGRGHRQAEWRSYPACTSVFSFGILRRTSVPPSLGLDDSTAPPSISARSRIAISPIPCLTVPGEKPFP